MNPSTNYETWMIFMNNCELIFRMYQMRQIKRKAAEDKINHLEESNASGNGTEESNASGNETDDDECEAYRADQSASGSSHINDSYVEDSEIMPPTVELHTAVEPTMELHTAVKQKIELVDSAMQTSGEWRNILCNGQTALVAKQQELPALTTSAAGKTDQCEAIEMQELHSTGRKHLKSYSNKAYECDSAVCSVDQREHYPVNSRSAAKDVLDTGRATFCNKSVKFSGCQVIKDSDNNSIPVHAASIYIPDTNLLSIYRKQQANQLKSAEAKWHRLREMELEQQGEILCYKGSCDSEARDVAFAQARHPLNPANFYFNVKVLETGSDNYIAIGLTSKHYPSYEMPGWKRKSVAYHADDGKLYIGKESGLHFGPKLQEGDQVSCGVLFAQDWSQSRNRPHYLTNKNTFISAYDNLKSCNRSDGVSVAKMFVMLNGEMVGVKMVGLVYGEYYPTIGLLSEGAKVQVDLLPTIAAAC